jgi:putative hemolysin
MFTDFLLELSIILAFTLANGFFAASEIALVSARRSRLEALAQAGSRGARQAIALAENSERFLAAVQIGITLIGTFSAAFGGARMSAIVANVLTGMGIQQSVADPLALALVVLLLTYVSLVFGELAPKQLAIQNPERVAVLSAPIITIVARVARPFIAFLALSVNTLLRLFGSKPMLGPLVTKEDILFTVREGSESGTVAQQTVEIIEQVFRLSERPVRAVMTPRIDIQAVDLNDPMDQVKAIFVEHQYSRLPVYEDTIDHIVGVLTARTFLRLPSEGAVSAYREQLGEVELVLENETIDNVMTRMVSSGRSMAIVLDEYGQTSGVVTLEDLLEEIIGEIRDEADSEESPLIVEREDGSWLVEGRAEFSEVQEVTGLPDYPALATSGYTTIAGMLLLEFGRIPAKSDYVTYKGYTLEVVDMDGPRIDQILMKRTPPEIDNGATDSHNNLSSSGQTDSPDASA